MNMQFFNNNNKSFKGIPIPVNKINSRFNFILNKPYNQPIIKNQLPLNPPETPSTVVPEGDGKKLKWGEPIWFLFHTLAEKVKEEYFLQIRQELINIIVSICSNLPCPKCTAHATQYLQKVNFNSIQTKSDFKKLLFLFHNEVNKNKNLPLFPYNDLDDKYSKANTKNIIQYFISEYSKTDFNVTMLSENMQRGMIIDKLKKWFIDNINYFDL
jgi:hypothetical protein